MLEIKLGKYKSHIKPEVKTHRWFVLAHRSKLVMDPKKPLTLSVPRGETESEQFSKSTPNPFSHPVEQGKGFLGIFWTSDICHLVQPLSTQMLNSRVPQPPADRPDPTYRATEASLQGSQKGLVIWQQESSGYLIQHTRLRPCMLDWAYRSYLPCWPTPHYSSSPWGLKVEHHLHIRIKSSTVRKHEQTFTISDDDTEYTNEFLQSVVVHNMSRREQIEQ